MSSEHIGHGTGLAAGERRKLACPNLGSSRILVSGWGDGTRLVKQTRHRIQDRNAKTANRSA